MYAIRSYYDLRAVAELERGGDQADDDCCGKLRITSYNVCYTKLLRRRLGHRGARHRRGHDRLGDLKRRLAIRRRVIRQHRFGHPAHRRNRHAAPLKRERQ